MTEIRSEQQEPQQTLNGSRQVTPAAPQQTVQAPSTGKIVFIAMVVAAVTCSAILWGYDRYVAIHIASYDLKTYYEQLRTAVEKHQISPEDAGKRIEAAAAKIRLTPPNTVVISTEVVLGGKVATIPLQ